MFLAEHARGLDRRGGFALGDTAPRTYQPPCESDSDLNCLLRRGPTTQGTVRPAPIVLVPPRFDHQLRLARSEEALQEHHNVAITDPTGTGRTFIARALAHHACRSGYRARYRRLPRLFEELKLAHANDTYTRLLARLARIDVLVIDDWELAPLRDQDRRDLHETFEDHYGTRSTILTGQLAKKHWHDHVGEATVADAICDRLLNNAHRITLKGPSRRKEDAHSTPDTRRWSAPTTNPPLGVHDPDLAVHDGRHAHSSAGLPAGDRGHATFRVP